METIEPRAKPKSRSGFRLGFFLGLLAGLCATLFFTPRTGEEMREQVKETGIVLKERAIGMMTGVRPYQPESSG